MTGTADQLETLARAICAADGRDPDAVVPRPADAGSGELAGDVPQWRLYEAQARRMIDAQLAL